MGLEYKEHPLLEIPSDEDQLWMLENDPEAYLQSIQVHNDRIDSALKDPVYNSFVLPQQEKVKDLLSEDIIDELWVLGGNRSGKSRSAAWLVMRALLENPNTEIICWSQNEKASIERQQPYLWEMMPAQYKRKMKDEITKMNYSKGTGFAGEKFILPNGSVCYFKYYTQFQQDDTTIEGAKLGAPKRDCEFINIGTWCDEYLGNEDLLKRLRSRCGDFDAKILLTFTPIHGYTPTVGTMLDGAKTVESLPASLLDGRLMPFIQQPMNSSGEAMENVAVVYYHSERNPFSNWKRLARNHANATEEEIMKILYGYPTKSMTAMFNTFDRAVHVYDPKEENYDFSDGSWTTYQVIDPAGTKSWACIWASVNANRDIRIWAEFPDRDTYGAWAVEGKSSAGDDSTNWKLGEAAKDCGGLSFRELEMEWTKIEDGVKVFERIIDVRFAHNPHQTKDDGKKTLQDELFEYGIDTVPSIGTTEDVGLPLIQEALSYDRTKPYCPHTNTPRLRFSTTVGNAIFSMTNYCKNGKRDDALKDFIDCIRYLLTANGGEGPEHYAPEAFKSTSTVGGY